MKELYEILKEHNDIFIKLYYKENEVDSNMKSPNLHMCLINTINTLINNINSFESILELRHCLRSSLNSSVIGFIKL